MAKTVICDLLKIFQSSVSAVLPENLIRKSIKYCANTEQLTILGENYNLQKKNVFLIGFGKAVQNMANEIENVLDTKITQGIISIPIGSLNNSSKNKSIKYYEGAKNNLPDTNAEAAARKIKDLVTTLGEDDLLLVLISGGGSALLPLPKSPITLHEKTELIKKLANCGADITELNSVRKRISDLKGGQLAMKAQPAQVVSLILSDIVGDPLDLIASGPTTENEDNLLKAINILKKYKLFDYLPVSISTVLKENSKPEVFPKNKVKNYILGSNKLSIDSALKEAKSLNYLPLALSNTVTGNIKDIAMEYSKLTEILCEYLIGQSHINETKYKITTLNIPGLNKNIIDELSNYISEKYRDLCLIFGGETTVEVKGNGKGGRNQQLALEFSKCIHHKKKKLNKFDVYFLSAGTDGIDGPTDAAGGIGYLNLIENTKKEGIALDKYIDCNDSYSFYKSYKKGELHVITGHTNTNVMDIHLIIIKRII